MNKENKEDKKTNRPIPQEQGDLDEFIFGTTTEQLHSEK